MRAVSIQLAPADLGRLSIRLGIAEDEIHAVIRAQSEETLAILERHLPELEAALGDQGFEGASFEFVLDQRGSMAGEEWHGSRDLSNRLEALAEEQLGPLQSGSQTLSDIAVDTYA